MGKPKISVITVCYNAVDVIEKTILSVTNQTYNNIEFIVVDGGSTDGTISIIKRYEKQIDKWISEPDEGIYDAMNKGIKMASGGWLNFMNAGDVFTRSDLLSDIFSLEIPDNIQFLYSDYWMSLKDGNYYLHRTDRGQGVVHHQSSIYRRSLHNAYGFYLIQKPYSVYDLLFFLSVPRELFMKIPFEIAKVDGSGISNQGFWAKERAEAACVVFGIRTLRSAYFRLLKVIIRNSLPFSVRKFVSVFILRHKIITLEKKFDF